MEQVTRYIKRQKGEREIIYPFTTFDIIFEGDFSPYPINLGRLLTHLKDAFTNGMCEAQKSPSEAAELHADVKHYSEHPFSKLANDAAYYGQGSKQHWIVQKHFLNYDDSTIAVEVPLWDEESSGCADIIRYVAGSDRIQILDFKPKAKAEKKVTGQLFQYAKLLSVCTGIPLSKIDLFYFDGEDTYQVTF